MDDASGTDYATALTQDDRRVRLVRSPQNLGKGGARNAGLAAATGGWVGFLDDDDELLPHALGTLYAMTQARGGSPAVYRGAMLVDRGGGDARVVTPFFRSADPWISALFEIGNIFPWIAPAASAKAIQFRSRSIFQDADFFLRLTTDLPIVRMPEPLGIYHLYGASSSAQAAVRTDADDFLTEGLVATDELFESTRLRIASYRAAGVRRLARAARIVWHASTFDQYPILRAWRVALQECCKPIVWYWLARVTYLRVEKYFPALRSFRVRLRRSP